MARMQAFGQGTLLHLRDPNGGPPLRYRPRVHTSIGMQADVGQHSRLHGSATYVGRRFDSSVPTGDVWVGGFALLDLTYTWLGRGWEGYVAIDNAFNRQAYEVVGTGTGERRLRAGLPWNL
jgi:vitamin B12 transporter